MPDEGTKLDSYEAVIVAGFFFFIGFSPIDCCTISKARVFISMPLLCAMRRRRCKFKLDHYPMLRLKSECATNSGAGLQLGT
jgi:hypothetical protein